MSDLSIRIKYSIPLFIVMLALLATLASNVILTNSLQNEAKIFPDNFMPAISAVLNADRDLYQARVAEVQYVHTEQDNLQLKQDMQENAQQAKDRFNLYMKLMANYPDVLRQLSDFDKLFQAWLQQVSKVTQSKDQGSTTVALQLVNNESKQAFSALRELYDIAGESAFKKAKLLQEEIEATNTFYKTISLIITLLIIAIASVVAYFSQQSLLRRISEITDGINDITSGGGDLTNKIKIKHKDEIGDLSSAFNSFVESLRVLVAGVRGDVKKLGVSSSELINTANKGNEVAAKQSEASDLIVSAVHQMSTSTTELAKIALVTSDETKQAMEFTNSGVDMISNSVTEINQLYSTIEGASGGAEKLSTESENISSVLDVIRGIAEQTNLLALNAAIEAARAGEQGRGFAVVADEVRNLAQKTQQSTDSIQGMIEALQSGVSGVVEQIGDGFNKVTSTVDLIKETESSLSKILASITTVSDMSTQTATATEQQQVVTEEINRNLHNLNDQINTTSDIANETFNVSGQVETLAGQINKGVSRFKV